jgi:hypothetical protein
MDPELIVALVGLFAASPAPRSPPPSPRIALGALTVWIAQADGWWIIVAVVPGLVAAACAYLFVNSLREVHRDSGGTPLRPDSR